MVIRVRKLLQQFFDEIEIVCFVRPQIEVALSLASTAARVGKLVDLNFFNISNERFYYNYYEMLSMWIKVFGKKNINVVSFKRNINVVKFFSQK